jgi:hypothetical protein
MTTTPSRYTRAHARKDRSTAVSHAFFPLAIYLLKESITNSIRFGASLFNIKFTWNKILNAWKVETQDNGTGNADFDRMNGPSENDGDDTSRYGFGDWARQVFGDPTVWMPDGGLPARRISKKAGEKYADSIITGPLPNFWSPTKIFYCDTEESPFEPNVDSHGFYNMTHIAASEITNVTDRNLLEIFREIVTVGFNQEKLDALRITVSINGVQVADSHADKWISLENALIAQMGVLVNDDGVVETSAGDVKIRAHRMRHMLGIIPNFPKYGQRLMDTSLMFMFQGGIMIEERKTHEVLGLAMNASNQQGCIAFVDFSLADPRKPVTCLPTPAATKTAYRAQCPIYLACRAELKKIRGNDNNWVCYPARIPSRGIAAPQLEAPPAPKKETKKKSKKEVVVAAAPPPPVVDPPVPAVKKETKKTSKKEVVVAAPPPPPPVAVLPPPPPPVAVLPPPVPSPDAAKIAAIRACVNALLDEVKSFPEANFPHWAVEALSLWEKEMPHY